MKRDWNICSINNCCTWKDIFEHFMNTKVLYEHKLFLILCKITLESGSIEKMYLMRKKNGSSQCGWPRSKSLSPKITPMFTHLRSTTSEAKDLIIWVTIKLLCYMLRTNTIVYQWYLNFLRSANVQSANLTVGSSMALLTPLQAAADLTAPPMSCPVIF